MGWQAKDKCREEVGKNIVYNKKGRQYGCFCRPLQIFRASIIQSQICMNQVCTLF